MGIKQWVKRLELGSAETYDFGRNWMEIKLLGKMGKPESSGETKAVLGYSWEMMGIEM